MGEQERAKILVIEDDQKISYGLVRGLEQHGFETRSASTGDRGLEMIFAWSPDLVVLDLMLPGIDGHEILRRCRARTSVPFLVLTARTGLDVRLESFSLGAIDFMEKPFWLEELVARIQARLAPSLATEPVNIVTWANVSVDLDARRLERAGEPIALTPHEFNLLVYMVQRPGRALTRAQLAEGALSMSQGVSDRTVDSHIARLRKKLGDAAAASIATVWGIGYRFEGSS